MRDEELIDRFVEVLNQRGFESLAQDHVTEELRTTGVPDETGWYEWKIRPAASNPWVAELEQRMVPHRFPELYLSLISRYRFAEFEIGPILFFANTGQRVWRELSDRIAGDRHMSPVLLEQGLLQFGNPYEANYDPVCFATQRMKNGDAPVVQIDHEDILSRNHRGCVVQEIATSFRSFVERALAGEFRVNS
jgi:hypothetical protein